MPRGARFGALWDPLGVRRMLFGRKHGFMDVFFTRFISSRFSVGVFIDFSWYWLCFRGCAFPAPPATGAAKYAFSHLLMVVCPVYGKKTKDRLRR